MLTAKEEHQCASLDKCEDTSYIGKHSYLRLDQSVESNYFNSKFMKPKNRGQSTKVELTNMRHLPNFFFLVSIVLFSCMIIKQSPFNNIGMNNPVTFDVSSGRLNEFVFSSYLANQNEYLKVNNIFNN